MFIPEANAYTAPVKNYEQLVGCIPADVIAEYISNPPVSHVVTIKTCNSPYLLSRSLASLNNEVDIDYITPVVIDDSKTADFRANNKNLTSDIEGRYCAISGEESLVASFSRYIADSEPLESKNALIAYLDRITTDFPVTPSVDNWGGVAGAQNVGHLANVMYFGENQIPRQNWLSTFIDDDVLMPESATEIFRMIGIYHTLGSVSVVASGYLHHSGNPIALAARSLEYLAAHVHEMSVDDVGVAIDNILARTPHTGLRDKNASDSKYSSNPEFTLVFPGGNYTLSGDKAFDIPVPVVGIDDLGFIALLQLFRGARQLGVARVPDFIHMRHDRRDGGNVHGDLQDFCHAEKDIVYGQFQEMATEFAANDLHVSAANIEGFKRVETAKRASQLRRQRETVEIVSRLANDERLVKYCNVFTSLKRSIRNFALAKVKGVDEPVLDRVFMHNLIKDMADYHPRLIQKAYEFGANGEFAAYTARCSV